MKGFYHKGYVHLDGSLDTCKGEAKGVDALNLLFNIEWREKTFL